ncbi:MAG: hypothetical protein QXX79_04300, partial [Candidatus Bathyarchaeia archaeon]
IQLRQSPCGKTGSSDWQKFEYTLEIPNNITQVRIVLNAGWVLDASKGSAITWFDDIKITACNQQSDKMGAANGDLLQLLPSIEASKQLQIIKSSKYKIAIRTFSSLNSGPILIEIGNNKFEINIASNEPKFEIFYTPAFFINKGTYDLSISSNGNSLLDVIYIFSVEKENETLEDIFKSEENPANIITYQKINPTKYTAKINATKPFMLSFAEAYDPLWVCYANGEKISSIPLYGAINGFWINQTGTLEITIEYEPQKWFQTGTTISATTFITCTAYLTYTRTKQKRLTKNKKPKT